MAREGREGKHKGEKMEWIERKNKRERVRRREMLRERKGRMEQRKRE